MDFLATAIWNPAPQVLVQIKPVQGMKASTEFVGTGSYFTILHMVMWFGKQKVLKMDYI